MFGLLGKCRQRLIATSPQTGGPVGAVPHPTRPDRETRIPCLRMVAGNRHELVEDATSLDAPSFSVKSRKAAISSSLIGRIPPFPAQCREHFR
jgi:hypothetical protein